MPVDDCAIVVGITRYPELGDLNGPENDAKDFVKWLKSRRGGNLQSKNIIKVFSSHFSASANPLQARPKRGELEEAFDEFYDQGQNSGRVGRRLYIFLAGHGFGPKIEQAALLMANAARLRPGHNLPARDYADRFRVAAFFDEVVLFVDCCREDYTRSLRYVHLLKVKASHPARHYYAFATESSDAAREAPDQQTGRVRGLFSSALLAGLDGKARDDAGRITGSSLEAFVHSSFDARAGIEEYQTPEFYYNKMDDIELVPAPPQFTPPYRVRVALSSDNRGRTVQMLRNGLQPVPSSSSSATLWEWNLTMGLYKVRVPGGLDELLDVTGERGIIDVSL